MTHDWRSSPYWPVKGIFQFTCSKCGERVTSQYAPSIGPNNIVLVTLNNRKEKTNVSSNCSEILKKWNNYLTAVGINLSWKHRVLIEELWLKLLKLIPDLEYPTRFSCHNSYKTIQMVWEKDDTHVNVTLLNNETFDWFYSKEDAGSLEEGNGTIDQILPKLEKILYEYRS